MTFGSFSTNSIKTFNGLTNQNLIPKEKKPATYSFNDISKTKSASPFGGFSLASAKQSTPLVFGNITHSPSTDSNIISTNQITDEQKIAAKGKFIEEFNDNYHELGQYQKEVAEFIDSHSNGIDTDSDDFQNLSPEAQEFFHKAFYSASGVKTKDIPKGQKVKIEPKDELKN